MTEGRLTHHLMAARDLTENRPELSAARYFIDAAIQVVRKVHRG